ncbi:unnamed protein product [Adineta ricciae]|uniref:Uncharacterized protein n=1 Tax=Adineta ricciae TaxID=249248 RepID=A0A815TFM5_ADIRI|nr:unnamed protein product [Adineta ricciae]
MMRDWSTFYELHKQDSIVSASLTEDGLITRTWQSVDCNKNTLKIKEIKSVDFVCKLVRLIDIFNIIVKTSILVQHNRSRKKNEDEDEMEDPTEFNLLHDDHLMKSNGKIPKASRYPTLFLLIIGGLGLLCLISAVILTIIGSLGLRDYGFANNPLIAGIILFGIGGAFSIVACISAGLKK